MRLFTWVLRVRRGDSSTTWARPIKPVVVDRELELRKMMNLSPSCDHRVVDGWYAASFIQDLRKLLENPLRLLSMR